MNACGRPGAGLCLGNVRSSAGWDRHSRRALVLDGRRPGALLETRRGIVRAVCELWWDLHSD
jgi:hypothetical protein